MSCAKVCDCNNQLANSAIGCLQQVAVEKRAWIVNKYDATGALNFIDLTSLLDDTYFSGLINKTDPLARWYPLPEIKNITDARDKPVVYSWKDNTEVFVRDGIRKFEGMFPPESASPQLISILESERCAKPCKVSVDANGTIWGKLSADGTKLYPLEMDAQSVAAIYVKRTDTEPQMLGYSFNYHPSEKDCQIAGLEVSELAGGINPLDYNGLMDIYVKVISCTTTILTVKLYNAFGTALNPETIKGFVVGNFSLYNVTTSSAIALTGTGSLFTESPQGTYALKYATANVPSSTNHLRLTPAKSGYDPKAVVATDIVVA